MSSTTFVDQVTPVPASWLNDVNTNTYTTVPALATTVASKANAGTLASSGITGAAASGANSDITSLGALAAVPSVITTAIAAAGAPQLFPITASVAANALTINLATTNLDFRNPTLTNGAANRLATGALSITVPSTATLGSVSGTPLRVGVAVAYNGGTPVLCVVNGTVDESALYSPTTISTGATAIGTVYSASAVSASSPMRMIGYVDVPNTTAGAYAAITQVQSYGGTLAPASLGVGQTWQIVTRTVSTTYYNTTGKPVEASITVTLQASQQSNFSVGGTVISTLFNGNANADVQTHKATIPPGTSYLLSNAAGSPGFGTWTELR